MRFSLSLQSKTFSINSSSLLQPPSIHSPRTPGDNKRHRKCSIVKEEDADEDHHDSDTGSLNRRGSRSEGRINLSVQEVLSSEMNERLKLQKDTTKRPQRLEVRTKLFDGISNVKLVGKNENEKFLGHAGMGLRKDFKISSHHKQPLFNKYEFKSKLSSNQSSSGCDNINISKKKSSNNSSTEEEDESDDKKKPLKTSFNLNYKYSKQRRDSHDDSSDSQEPATGTSNRILINIEKVATSASNKQSSNEKRDTNNSKDKTEGVKNKKLYEEPEDNEEEEQQQQQQQEVEQETPLTDHHHHHQVSENDQFMSSNNCNTSKFLPRSSTSNSKANKNHSNGKVKKNSSRFLSFLRETSSDVKGNKNYKSNRKSFSDAEFLKIKNEKVEKEFCPNENLQSRKLVGRYFEVKFL